MVDEYTETPELRPIVAPEDEVHGVPDAKLSLRSQRRRHGVLSDDGGHIGLAGSSPTGRYRRASNGNCHSGDGVDGDDDQVAHYVV